MAVLAHPCRGPAAPTCAGCRCERDVDRREFLTVAAAIPAMAGSQKRSDGTPALSGHSSNDEICFMDATELARLIKSRAVSAGEVMQACLTQIDRVNPKVNAICTL